MKTYILIFYFIFSKPIYADCEDHRFIFNNIKKSSISELPNILFSYIHKRNGGLLVKDNYESDLIDNNFFKKVLGKYGTYDGISFESASHETLPSFNKNFLFLKFKDELDGLQSEQIVLIDLKKRNIKTLDTKYLPGKIVQYSNMNLFPEALKKILTKSYIREKATNKFDYDFNRTLLKKWSKQSFESNGWELINVQIEFPFKKILGGDDPSMNSSDVLVEKVEALRMWYSFLTNDQKQFWFFGLSDYNSCADKYAAKSDLINENGRYIFELPILIFLKYGLKLDRNQNEILYRINGINNEESNSASDLYYLNFKKIFYQLNNDSFNANFSN